MDLEELIIALLVKTGQGHLQQVEVESSCYAFAMQDYTAGLTAGELLLLGPYSAEGFIDSVDCMAVVVCQQPLLLPPSVAQASSGRMTMMMWKISQRVSLPRSWTGKSSTVRTTELLAKSQGASMMIWAELQHC